MGSSAKTSNEIGFFLQTFNIFKEYSTGDKKVDFIHVFANIMEGVKLAITINDSE